MSDARLLTPVIGPEALDYIAPAGSTNLLPSPEQNDLSKQLLGQIIGDLMLANPHAVYHPKPDEPAFYSSCGRTSSLILQARHGLTPYNRWTVDVRLDDGPTLLPQDGAEWSGELSIIKYIKRQTKSITRYELDTDFDAVTRVSLSNLDTAKYDRYFVLPEEMFKLSNLLLNKLELVSNNDFSPINS